MTKLDLIHKLQFLSDEIEKQPRYGMLGALGLSMALWGSGKNMKRIEGLFLEVEEMMKLLYPDETMRSDGMKRFIKHHTYYDYSYQKIRKVRKEIGLLIQEIKSEKMEESYEKSDMCTVD
ncbi:MAG: hypothetical protein J6K75_08055 [Erysipelotrichaceae bacterium]|nr:hypothetical protein [Erysipelotrichaceae bacterium]